MGTRQFVDGHYHHFNAAVIGDASRAWCDHLASGGDMFLAMGGAMSTAELGISLAEMIREGKIHAISTTGANLEEDIFNLIAHNHYKRLPNYRDLSESDEVELHSRGMNRVTDTCIPEEEAMRKLENRILRLWKNAEENGKRYFPYEIIYQLFQQDGFREEYEADPKNSWVYAAYEKKMPIFTPGWEDSTLGNFFVANRIKNHFQTYDIIKSGPEQMESLIQWYQERCNLKPVGFFQIGGGIAGDFAICVVPLLNQDLKREVPVWAYFAQISDSTTSFGSYSGAVPNEKITWGKLDAKTPRFIIESDASIVAPIIFQYVLDR